MSNFIRFFSSGSQRIKTAKKRKQYWQLNLLYTTGFLISVIELTRGITERQSGVCMPGDVVLAGIFLLGLISLNRAKAELAINLIFLIPVPSYFFFMSNYSAAPVQQSIIHTQWTLIGGLLFLFLFNNSAYKLFYYYIVSLVTVAYQLLITGSWSELISVHISSVPKPLNPTISLTISYFIAIGIRQKYHRKIGHLQTKIDQTAQEINSAQRTLSLPLAIIQLNTDEDEKISAIQLVTANSAFEKLFGINVTEIKTHETKPAFQRFFPSDFDWEKFFFTSYRHQDEFFDPERQHWYKLLKIRLSSSKIACLFIDQTSQHTTISQLQESRQRYKVLLEAIPDLFFIISREGLYVDYVIRSADQLQLNPDKIVGSSIFETGFSMPMARKIYQAIQNAIRFDTIETIEYAMNVEQGTVMFEMRIARLNDQQVISISRDITKRKMTEIQLEDARQKAEESDRLKSAFLANISHEIRTPMNAIIGFSKMLDSSDFEVNEKRQLVSTIISNGKILMDMVDNMISISKIETNQIEAHFLFCKINELLLELFKEYSTEQPNKTIHLRLVTPNHQPKFGFFSDRNLLIEIFQKLINNALKFTEKGEVVFGYNFPENNPNIRFFVRDTGIGIDHSYQKKIFERFYQIDNRRSRKYEGTGLGLAIANYLTEQLHGKLMVSSEPDKGSEFYFDLPFEQKNPAFKIE